MGQSLCDCNLGMDVWPQTAEDDSLEMLAEVSQFGQE
jgi:hypothetical protein